MEVMEKSIVLTIVQPTVSYMIRTDNFMNVHVTNCRVKVVTLTQYRRVRTSVIHLRGVYATCNLRTKEQFKNNKLLTGK